MAIDEAWLRATDRPVLRFYRWAAPAVTFGYFGEFGEVAAMVAGRDVARRWTGGGIVEHGSDTTYALLMPARAGVAPLRAREVYAWVHHALAGALIPGDQPLALAPSEAVVGAGGHCFERPVAGDLVRGVRKLAGAAQRRTREGLLHQGSVAVVMGQAERLAFAQALGQQVDRCTPGRGVCRESERLVHERYGRLDWLQSR